ncbi:MAG: DUF1549 domain-containing protein [Pirellulales bacterium]
MFNRPAIRRLFTGCVAFAATAGWSYVLTATERRVTFENDIIPILSRFGCNSSGCHGKAEGQNGFKLSVFGFDPGGDYDALTREGRGRRVFPGVAGRSLLLQKISGAIPHGGGVRIDADRPEFKLVRNWIESGVPRSAAGDPVVERVDLSPREAVLSFGRQQKLRVVATYSDGATVDVTPLAQFQSNHEGLAKVNESGLVTVGQRPGNVAIMATFLGRVDTFRALIPQRKKLAEQTKLAESNFVDPLVHRQLRRLNIAPSRPATDAEFLRRVYLDIIGTLPRADEARIFLADERTDKRSRLVDRLLQRPEFADYWALKWSDLLRVNRRELGHKQAYEYYRWIHQSFAQNKPLDRFATELLTAAGALADVPAGHFYQVVKQPGEMASTVSQLFLGVRIECAQCHHHPYDRWSQTDYYGMQAFFTQVGLKKSPRGEMLLASSNSETKHPQTGEVVFAHALSEPVPAESPKGDRRQLLAAWVTSADNRWFARNLANRAWADLLGRGIVEPIDDFRLTNPPSNPELLDALAKHLVEHQFDCHELIRTIAGSRTYQRSCQVNDTNEQDEQNFSRYPFKPIEAEVLLDAVCQVTGTSEKFSGVPYGSRAIQLWDSEVRHDFLKLFGRPTRVTPCECERVNEPTVGQVLHALNSPRIQTKLSHVDGRISDLLRQFDNDDNLVEELYLAIFSRYPTKLERKTVADYLSQNSNRRQATEDIAWSMLNSLEFLFNH